LNIWVHLWPGYWGATNYSLHGKGFANFSNPLVMGNASKAADIDSWVSHGNVGAAGTTERKYYWYYCDVPEPINWLSPQWVQAPPIPHRALLLMAAATDVMQGLLYWTTVGGWISRLPYNGTAWANVTTTGAAPHGYAHSQFVERVNGTMYTNWIPSDGFGNFPNPSVAAAAAGDGAGSGDLVYAGKDGPVTTLRMEMLHASIEDFLFGGNDCRLCTGGAGSHRR
jgi:hypothetical protein